MGVETSIGFHRVYSRVEYINVRTWNVYNWVSHNLHTPPIKFDIYWRKLTATVDSHISWSDFLVDSAFLYIYFVMKIDSRAVPVFNCALALRTTHNQINENKSTCEKWHLSVCERRYRLWLCFTINNYIIGRKYHVMVGRAHSTAVLFSFFFVDVFVVSVVFGNSVIQCGC